MTDHPAYGKLRHVRAGVRVLLADNPSPMTLEGTNTWLLGDADALTVVDPGPADPQHVERIAAAGRVEQIVLTHRHEDHSGGVSRLQELTGAPVHAADPAYVRGGSILVDGDVLHAGEIAVRVVATPGHTSDSISLVVGEDAVLTGDTILGLGTTVVAHPDGVLADYLDSLRRLSDLGDIPALCGHGAERPTVRAAARAYLVLRMQRLEQVRAVVADKGPNVRPRHVVRRVYADVDRALWGAAELSVKAQLEYLRHHD